MQPSEQENIIIFNGYPERLLVCLVYWVDFHADFMDLNQVWI